MSNHQDVLSAKVTLKTIIDELKIQKIVFVDDEYERKLKFEEIKAAVRLLDDDFEKICEEFGITYEEDKESAIDDIEEKWNNVWDDEKKKSFHDRCYEAERLKSAAQIDDPGDAGILAQLLDESLFVPLSPKQWLEKEKELIEESKNINILFLFDHQFNHSEAAVANGMTLLQKILHEQPDVKCGLLTHTATIDNQIEKWDSYAQEFGLELDDFLVIPKAVLNQSPKEFVMYLKKTFLIPQYKKIKVEAVEILKSSVGYAASEIEKINILDLDYIIFKVSGCEGSWEPDMLFRLHSLFQKSKSRELAYANGNLEELAKIIRPLSNIDSGVEKPSSYVNSIQSQELYEDGAYINSINLPLEIGDIFQKTGSESSKFYILLGQPCDLMVRSSGKRGPMLEGKVVPLIEVKEVTGSENPEFTSELPFFDETGKKYFAHLNRVHFTEISNLDFCVFNKNGEAEIALQDTYDLKLIPSWQKRYVLLREQYSKCIEKIDFLAPEEQEAAESKKKKKDIIQKVFSSKPPFKVDVNFQNQRISFGVKRVKRLNKERAYGLLIAYSSIVGRPAYDRTFGSSDSCLNSCDPT